ncbi:WD40/YVTN/BNR-like repeat-containing protein [Paraburkholderia bannensis]|uniref:WD40/YVTN/BNR-like repeat-containing protein n=1 Tax=Paraburkholderia bannensis TaxID=765414 RepID=UPI002AC33B64|nr:glycosyl hydrolase [Paraburkholderia bannensis]
MIAILSCNGGTVTHGEGPATTLLVATLRGMQVFGRSGEADTWRLTRTALEHLHVSALLYEPESKSLFAGAHGNGGLWVSEDLGMNWKPCSEGIKSAHIYTLAAQPRAQGVVLYAGTEPSALYRSDDLGRRWTEVSAMLEVPGQERWEFPPPPHIAHVKNVAFHPDEPQTLYVCIEQGALLKTVDDGRTWTEPRSYESGQDKFYHDNHRVLIRRSNPAQLFMCGGEGLHYSADAGESWTHLMTRADAIGYPDAMFIDPRDENVLYLGGPGNAPREWAARRSADAKVLRSVDGGVTWQPIRNGLPEEIVGNIEGMGLYHWDDRIMLIAGTATGEVYASEDDGANWYTVATGLPPISKGGHYRWFLDVAAREKVEDKMRAGA